MPYMNLLGHIRGKGAMNVICSCSLQRGYDTVLITMVAGMYIILKGLKVEIKVSSYELPALMKAPDKLKKIEKCSIHASTNNAIMPDVRAGLHRGDAQASTGPH